MKVAIIGGGPSGLYLGMLLRKWGVAENVHVFERNPKGATYGFGVTLADKALSKLAAADKETHDALLGKMTWVQNQTYILPDDTITVTSPMKGGALARVDLVTVLAEAAVRHGVEVFFETNVSGLGDLAEYDLVVGADGSNSWLRDQQSGAFGVSTYELGNRFAWYGVDKAFETPTLSFQKRGDGIFVGHYYQYTADKSTFVAEVDEATWRSSGLAEMSQSDRTALTEITFADELEGSPLIDSNSVWRQFRVVHTKNWVTDRTALIGDALYPAHFSIGSGTRLAMEDAIALAEALKGTDSVVDGLQMYQDGRQKAKARLMDAAEKSFQWYEDVRIKIELPPHSFVFDFLTRTDRLTKEMLRIFTPAFMADYDASLHTEVETKAAS